MAYNKIFHYIWQIQITLYACLLNKTQEQLFNTAMFQILNGIDMQRSIYLL